ncbi:MAG: MFS transporter, partial [Fulvivirga sp.]|uniref:MFS transporter n=1 Tax=Fulvivirga sp. TaxID=1931237 RepID=UPI0032EEBC42
VGVLLAGIYPVGMKIAADYYQKGLDTALGYLVGALVLGTALPHLINFLTIGLNWKMVIYSTSGLAFVGGIGVLLFVPDGPYRKPAIQLKLSAIFDVFRNKKFKKAAFGYFGHMWELYTFWAFIPFLIYYFNELNSIELNVSLWSFLIIAIGGVGCVIGGYISINKGAKQTAAVALLISGLCCLLSPIIILYSSTSIFLLFLLVWGFAVITDSPLFSTLVATNANAEIKGTALTIVNCIGFALTIISIQLIQYLSTTISSEYLFLFLVPGPVFGLISLFRK